MADMVVRLPVSSQGGCNRPATMMTTKMTVKSEAYVELLGGVVQAATADAIIDCVAEG